MFLARRTRVAEALCWLKEFNHYQDIQFISSEDQPDVTPPHTPALIRHRQVDDVECEEGVYEPDVDYSGMPPLEGLETPVESESSATLLSYVKCYRQCIFVGSSRGTVAILNFMSLIINEGGAAFTPQYNTDPFVVSETAHAGARKHT
ncbi:hypothetical protein BD779DRAFT_1475389 [Infundibulicybe gibba]|nr:hypothetical protein BD779DRAFT_1475389 [Infundibulicybe gibba]